MGEPTVDMREIEIDDDDQVTIALDAAMLMRLNPPKAALEAVKAMLVRHFHLGLKYGVRYARPGQIAIIAAKDTSIAQELQRARERGEGCLCDECVARRERAAAARRRAAS